MTRVSGGTAQGSRVGRRQETFKSSTRGKDHQETRHRNGRGSEDHAYLGYQPGREDTAARPTPLDLVGPLNNKVPGCLFLDRYRH